MKKLWKWLFGKKKQQCNIHDVSNSDCVHQYWHRAGFTNIGVCNDCGANFYIKQTER